MIVEPKIRGFICTRAHPEGCAQHVAEWIHYIRQQSPISSGPKKVLIIGASTGFGLASRIAAAFGARADTIGVFFEKPAIAESDRTASAGWYNSAAFEKAAHAAGLYAKSINGDAFSDAIKKQVFDLIQRDWHGKVDLVIYSIAAPRRQHPVTGELSNSVLKPIGQTYRNKTVDIMSGQVTDITIAPATEKEIADTIAVMGGEDWAMWIDALLQADLLAPGAVTLAFTYLGPVMTHPIYRQGTIGKAKEHLEATAKELHKEIAAAIGGCALISVNKALVTQASAAIPVVPLYISLLYKAMKEKRLHEGCIEQMYRLLAERLYQKDQHIPVDSDGRIRIDDWEMREDIQTIIAERWQQVCSDNLEQLADLKGYRAEFYQLFGFHVAGIDYTQDVNIQVPIPSILE
ncbi:MAG: trans-2-enoyl-CoA reductase [Coxiella sp. RIFCSPHIGHO2_12_FULL_44_14]|nr:MAG: trans-2-enoyl-CoA reductase [Coxiella sp. RIFCSPHIGHO2_12_FULL_44_14]